MLPPPPMPLMWISHAGKHTQQVCLTTTVCLPAKIQDTGHLQPKPAAHAKEENKIHLNLKVILAQNWCGWGCKCYMKSR